MRGVEFEQSTTVLGRPPGTTEEECGSLPVHQTKDGQCISCWELSDEDLETLKKTKRIWLWVWSGHTQPPVLLDVDHPWPTEGEEERYEEVEEEVEELDEHEELVKAVTAEVVEASVQECTAELPDLEERTAKEERQFRAGQMPGDLYWARQKRRAKVKELVDLQTETDGGS